MSCTAAEFCAHYFAELGRAGVDYVILHSYEGMPERIDSDVDYAVRDADLPRLRGLQIALGARLGWQVAQVLQHQVFAFYAVLVNRDDPAQFLKLDACSHYVKDRCFLMRDEELMAGRGVWNGFSIPAAAVEFRYVLAKVFGKNKEVAAYLPRLRELRDQDRPGAEAGFAMLCGPEAGELADWLERPAEQWAELNVAMRARHRYSVWLNIRELARVIRRVLRPTGLWVAFLGVDGAGKSTQIERLAVGECFRRVARWHFRPMLFERHETRAPVTEPHGQQPRSVVASWLKLFYYFADTWLGYLVKILPLRMQSGLIVFDRFLEDVCLDPRRYRLAGTAGLARLLCALAPKPDVVIGLDVPPETARARTPEISPEEIARQRLAMRARAAGDPRWCIVSAEPPANEVACTVGRILTGRMTRRLGASADWFGLFPTAGRATGRTFRFRIVKKAGEPLLILPPGAAARRALDLYPAQTQKAKYARVLLRAALACGWPRPRAALTMAGDDPFVGFLEEVTGGLGDFAILAGNPRAPGRRFLLLTFDRSGQPQQIVKAGVGEAAVRLIERERSILGATAAGPALRGVWNGEYAAAFALDYLPGRPPEPVDDNALGGVLTAWIDRTRTVVWEELSIAGAAPGLSGTRFHPTLWHGDFAPWNVRVAPDGAWQVFDWERGELVGPPGWDWFHYVLQRALLVERRNAPELAALAEDLLASPVFVAYAEAAGIRALARSLFGAYLHHCLFVARQTEGTATLAALHALFSPCPNA